MICGDNTGLHNTHAVEVHLCMNGDITMWNIMAFYGGIPGNVLMICFELWFYVDLECLLCLGMN